MKYKFKGSALQLSCWIRNAPAAAHATPLQFDVDFAATHHFTPNIELSDRKKQMPGWYVKTSEKIPKDKGFKNNTYNFWDLAKFKPEAQSLEIFGPWGARKITLHLIGSGEGSLRGEKRSGQGCFYSGFQCLFKIPAAPGRKTTSTTLAISVD